MREGVGVTTDDMVLRICALVGLRNAIMRTRMSNSETEPRASPKTHCAPRSLVASVADEIMADFGHESPTFGQRVSRLSSSTYSVVTTGKTLHRREEDGAIKVQAAFRGKQARDEVDDMRDQGEELGFLGFLCGAFGRSSLKQRPRRIPDVDVTPSAADLTPRGF